MEITRIDAQIQLTFVLYFLKTKYCCDFVHHATHYIKHLCALETSFWLPRRTEDDGRNVGNSYLTNTQIWLRECDCGWISMLCESWCIGPKIELVQIRQARLCETSSGRVAGSLSTIDSLVVRAYFLVDQIVIKLRLSNFSWHYCTP